MFDFIVAQKRVAEIQACKFLHQIIDGLDILHKNDVTHRDLKPEVPFMFTKPVFSYSFVWLNCTLNTFYLEFIAKSHA
jgi:hypothetical protein